MQKRENEKQRTDLLRKNENEKNVKKLNKTRNLEVEENEKK